MTVSWRSIDRQSYWMALGQRTVRSWNPLRDGKAFSKARCEIRFDQSIAYETRALFSKDSRARAR